MTPAEHLRAARKLIEKPENWTQGVFARASNGNPIGPEESAAVCWCAVGALRRSSDVEYRRKDSTYALLRNAMFLEASWMDVPWFNDFHTHAEVLAAFDRAIALAESTP